MKALCFQTEYPHESNLLQGRCAGSLLGFWRRPLQTGLRHLQVWRVITSVSSPYIPMLTYISLLLLIQWKTTLLHLDSLTYLRLPSRELAVCEEPLRFFSIHRENNMRFFFEWIWKTEKWRSPQQTKFTATGVIVRSQQSFLVTTVSDCCCSTYSTIIVFLLMVRFMSLLLAEQLRAVGPLGSDPRRSRGAVERRLGSSPRYRGKCRVHQWGWWEQFVPTNDCAW